MATRQQLREYKRSTRSSPKVEMTQTQKILAAKAGLEYVYPGQFIEADLDVVLANDITGPVAIREFYKMGATKVFDKDKVVLVPDHFTPNKDIKAAEQAKELRDFAMEQGLSNYFEVGYMGIEHALLPEQGLVTAGDMIIGADSHTCTYGAVGAFSTGVGSTDMAAGMATGRAWFKVPEAISFVLKGKFNRWVSGKDLILHIIGMIGVDGALYKSMEFSGEGISALSMDDRFTVTNMAIEAGAKNGIFPVDGRAREYLREHKAKTPKNKPQSFRADAHAEYERVIEIDLSKLRPTVAFPHLPENTRSIDKVGKVPIDQVVIGSCTNGRLDDMASAANIMKGKKIAKGVRCIILPGTQQVFLNCIKLGYADIFVRAGCVFSTPTCGPCLGGHMGVLAAGERAVSTTNRNFVGRMGHTDSEVYLASPAVAAAAALAGRLIAPDKV